MHYIIIGNGIAGINAANNIRRRDKTSDITIISKESDHFFSRTALMYVFCGQLSSRDVEPYQRDHYERMNFTRINDVVETVTPEKKSLRLKSGSDIKYDKLLIASGSVARMIDWKGQDLNGVSNFVTWQDMELTRQNAKNSKRACVVGGGLIGIEVCEVLLMDGISTSFIIRENQFWPVALDRKESDNVVKHMKHHGLDVQLQTECEEVLGENGKITGIRTKDGEIVECDMVVFTIGVRPQTDFLRDCGIELDKGGGIVVDDYLQTNIPDIWAAGDCTSVVWFNNVRRPEQLWYTSRDQGGIAGHNMVGDKSEYKRATFYNSAKFFNLEYTTAGYVNFNFDGEKNWYQHEPNTNYTERITCLPDNSVIGFNMIGRRWDHRILVDWIDKKRSIDYVLDHLPEAIFDEEFMSEFKVLEKSLVGAK